MLRPMLRTPASFLTLALLAAGCQYLPGSSSEAGRAGGGGAAEQQAQPAESAAPAYGGQPARPAARPPREAPPPTPRPTPKPRVVVVPAGTELKIELEAAVSSGSNRVGDLVLARVAEDVEVDGAVVVKAGSEVRGRVTAAVKSGRVKGRARLAVSFDTVEVRDRRRDIEANEIDITAGSTRKRDAALIGGGAVAGAVIDGKKGAGIGALLGGGAVLATKGKDVTLPAGTPVELKLKRDLRIE